MTLDRRAAPDPDSGTTVVELLFTIVIVGLVMGTLALAVTTSLRVAPDTETRIDDARATRSLATWLATDTISAPPFLPEQAQGGIVLDPDPLRTDNNDCGQPGENLVHLQWVETTDAERTFVSNYRWVTEPDGTTSIARHACLRTGPPPAAFVMLTSRTLTSGLSASQHPTVTAIFHPVTGDVTQLRFELTGATGEVVQLDTGSRNPAEFFP